MADKVNHPIHPHDFYSRLVLHFATTDTSMLNPHLLRSHFASNP